jgi:hypothetical protein
MSREIPGSDSRHIRAGSPIYWVASDGQRTELVGESVLGEGLIPVSDVEIPDWATLHWILYDDPRFRADWSRLKGYHPETFNKLSKSNS